MKLNRFSLCLLALWGSLLTGLLCFFLFESWLANQLLSFGLALVAAMALSSILLRQLMLRDLSRFEALKNGLANLRDNDFSVSIAQSNSDDIDELLQSYNQLVDKLRVERQRLYQRELLLDTVIENVSLALVLLDQNDTVIYSNSYASHLMNRGRAINGLKLDDFQSNLPDSFLKMVSEQSSGIISVEHGEETEQYHLSVGSFNFHSSQHRLILVKQLTRELNRQEVTIWRKVIRVISHELNNSLAPISSMAHSAKLAVAKAKPEPLLRALDTIAERAAHLNEFVGAYARLAKIPEPVFEDVQLEYQGFKI
jgi:two-component system nitrogen regulation sensor histidine kinase NtrY